MKWFTKFRLALWVLAPFVMIAWTYEKICLWLFGERDTD